MRTKKELQRKEKVRTRRILSRIARKKQWFVSNLPNTIRRGKLLHRDWAKWLLSTIKAVIILGKVIKRPDRNSHRRRLSISHFALKATIEKLTSKFFVSQLQSQHHGYLSHHVHRDIALTV